jgi:hypothetical protein
VQARAERLARINGDDGVARSGGVFAPRGANNNAAHSQDRKLGAPTRYPLFGGDRSYKEWSNTAQTNTAAREGGEAFELRY